MSSGGGGGYRRPARSTPPPTRIYYGTHADSPIAARSNSRPNLGTPPAARSTSGSIGSNSGPNPGTPSAARSTSGSNAGRSGGRESPGVKTHQDAPFPASPSPGRGKRPQPSQEEGRESDENRTTKKRLAFSHETDVRTGSSSTVVRVLLPNEKALKFTVDIASLKYVAALISLVQEQATSLQATLTVTRKIEWGPDVRLEDTVGNRVTDASLKTVLSVGAERGSISLLLQDGHLESKFSDPNLWNVTPKPEMLGKLPAGYSMDTALADHVDNALQAVYFNEHGDKAGGTRLVSVTLKEDKIVIFDTGRGMDGSTENCIDNWGTIGGSTHRAVHHRAVGVEPPFLLPYLGKYGAGGIAAAFHLGGKVTVTSKTSKSRNVAGFIFEPKALLQRHQECPGERTWTTSGFFQEPTKEEIESAPNGSFTKVEISKLKQEYCNGVNEHQYWNVDMMRQLLKDIYYPYIQCEQGASSQTDTPVRFEVNGKDLLEVTDCETAIYNMHTCNGEPFVFDLHMTKANNDPDAEGPGSSLSGAASVEEGNARITCNYYPKKKGKEVLETVLEEVAKLKSRNNQTFENMKRVTIRWLGRLLPAGGLQVLPFMEIPAQKERKLEIRRTWGKRALATIDTDAGFHPNQSKIELERDQPFASALTQVGRETFTGPAMGVTVTYKRNGKVVSSLELVSEYLEWVKLMHNDHDEEFVFVDQSTFVFNENNYMEEFGLGTQPVILFHKHMKDSTGDWRTDGPNPLRIKLPKNTIPGQKSDKYATVEYFYVQYTDDAGDVGFICRGLEVDPDKGSKIYSSGDHPRFALQESECHPGAILSSAKRLDEVTWKKKVEEAINKSPGRVELLGKDETDQLLEHTEVFPEDRRKEEAGFTLPSSFLAVVRPKRGNGSTLKQGMIFADPLRIALTATYCTCLNGCREKKVLSSPTIDAHTQILCKLESQPILPKGGLLKGVYKFIMTSLEASCLVLQGTYTFYFAVDSNRFKDVKPAVRSLHINPCAATAKWTLCNHSNDCGETNHDYDLHETEPVVLRLHKELEQQLFLQKFDKHGNRQTFEGCMDLKLKVFSRKGESLEMKSNIQCSARRVQGGQRRLTIERIIFTDGQLKALKPSYGAVLRACISEEERAEIKCTVLPGALASVEVLESDPIISSSSRCYFQRALQPEEVIKTLTIQALDSCGNNIEKGQKIRLAMKGLTFHDNRGLDREVDHNGCVELGGLLRVTCPYNSTGSLDIVSGRDCFQSIGFKTVTRKLVAHKAATRAYVSTKLSGVCVQLVDDCDLVDTSAEGTSYSVTVDWEKGVRYPLNRGECFLPDIQLPREPGYWKGHIHLSKDKSLTCTLEVEMVIGVASNILPPELEVDIFTAACGVPFVIPFRGTDADGNIAFLTEAMRDSIQGEPDLPCSLVWEGVKMTLINKIPSYAAHFILQGVVGVYTVTLVDGSLQLQGIVQAVCNLQHGKVSRLALAHAQSGGSGLTSLPTLEVARGSKLELTVSLIDIVNNVCTSCKNRTITMSIPGCHFDFRATVVKGVGQFQCLSLQVPIGEYSVTVCLDSEPDEVKAISAEFKLKVIVGNYPVALTFLGINDSLVVTLNNDQIQYLAPFSVLVNSADGKQFEHSPKVGVRIAGQSVTFESACTEETVFPDGNIRYECTQVCVPSRAGLYMMEPFVYDCNEVKSNVVQLIVRAGPAVRADIMHREPGQEVHNVQVQLLDSHGNRCEEVHGVEMQAKLVENTNSKASSTNQSGVVVNESVVTIARGIADFGAVLQVNFTKTGLYMLHLFAADEGNIHQSLQSLLPSQEKLLIVVGNVTVEIQTLLNSHQTLLQSYSLCTDVVKKAGDDVAKSRVEIQTLEAAKLNLQREWNRKNHHKMEVERLQAVFNDDQLFRDEEQMVDYTEFDCLRSLQHLAKRGQGAAWAFLDAQKAENFLSPQVLSESDAKQFWGLPVLLARVENASLQKVLSDYMAKNLLVIVCQSQRGVKMLEFHSKGDIDEAKGLAGFARKIGCNLGEYNVLSLYDCRPYLGAVDEQHPQRLLKLEPPKLRDGQTPQGFLGFAVNLLHINSDLLQMNIVTKVRSTVMGLRATLFYDLLRNLQIYNTREDMVAAKDAVRDFAGPAISLDGGVIFANRQQRLGKKRESSTVKFGILSQQERRKTSFLETPIQGAYQRSIQILKTTNELHAIRNEIAEKAQILDRKKAELVQFEKNLPYARAHEQKIVESHVMLEKQIEELNCAKRVIVGCSQNSNGALNNDGSERKRAFFI